MASNGNNYVEVANIEKKKKGKVSSEKPSFHTIICHYTSCFIASHKKYLIWGKQ